MERYTWVRFAGKLTSCHSTHIVKVSTPVGRWMKVQGKGRRQAHVISRVVMDITVFKVSHRVGIDKDTTALRAQKVERVTFHRGDGTLHMGSIRGKTHNLPDTAHSTGQHFNGAMERYMRGFDSAQNSPSPATAQHQQ